MIARIVLVVKSRGSLAWNRRYRAHEHRWKPLAYIGRFGNLYHIWKSVDIRGHVRHQWVPITTTIEIMASGIVYSEEKPTFTMPLFPMEKIYNGSIRSKKWTKSVANLS